MKLAALVVTGVLCLGAQKGATSPLVDSGRRIPQARAFPACAGAGPYWPTMTLALNGKSAWIACKEQARLLRINLANGRKTASVKVPGAVIAVTSGFGSVWALDTGSTLYRLNARTGRVTKRIALGAVAAYNIWIGGGSIWVADDQGARVIRVSPATNRVSARITVSDGPSDMVFAGTRAWVINHRDSALFSVDMTTNTATRLATVGQEAAERMVYLEGSLWLTGRGTPLLQVDPESGETLRSIDIGGTGIDIAVAAGSLWIPVRSAAVDRTGFPTMTALRRVTTAGAVTTAATARGRVDVHGVAGGSGAVWLADNTDGFLYRIPT